MGLSLSLLVSASKTFLRQGLFGLKQNVDAVMVRSISFDSQEGDTLRTISFKRGNSESDNTNKSDCSNEMIIEESLSFKKWKPERLKFETTVSFKNLVVERENSGEIKENDELVDKQNAAIFISPRPVCELDEAALKVQKVYKSYRTRRNLADCAVVVEELWWKALDFAALKRSSVSFFNVEKPESAVSRWARAKTRVAKVGKGLSKDEKAKQLALSHWLEAIDPRHRYGHNLHLYYNIWFESQSSQPFFYWLDVGDGKEVNLEKCPRATLQQQCIRYLGPKERKAYEVIIESGKLKYRQSGVFLDTVEGSKWIFVLSTCRNLYVAQKKKGQFQHSSFLAGAATTAAGRLVAHNGVLEAIWPYSGHYHPTEENFMEFISFLEEHHVDLTNVKRCAIDDDIPCLTITSDKPANSKRITKPTINNHNDNVDTSRDNVKPPVFELRKCVSSKWTTGAGPRIGCVREYPSELQFQALEHVKLSPRINIGPFGGCGPIPSPRPSPKIHLSSNVANMRVPSPRVLIPIVN